MALKPLDDLATKWINYENRLVESLKRQIRKNYGSSNIPERIRVILDETDRDRFFTKYLNYASENVSVDVTVTGKERRRLNVKVGNKKLEVPQHIWSEINSYEPPLTVEKNTPELLGYAWEVAGEYIVDNALKALSNQKTLTRLLTDGITKVQPINEAKQDISVDYAYDVVTPIDRNNVGVQRLNIDTKSNLYNFHLGDIYVDEFNRVLQTNYSQDYQNLVDYLKVHIINKKYGNKDVIFYSPSGTKSALTLGSVLSNPGGLHFKDQMSNNEIIKEATEIYMKNRAYYEEIGESGYNFIKFTIEGRNNKYSDQLEKDIINQAAETSSKKIAAALWYGR